MYCKAKNNFRVIRKFLKIFDFQKSLSKLGPTVKDFNSSWFWLLRGQPNSISDKYCICLSRFMSLITIAFMEGFQKKFGLTPFRMWLLELTLFKTTALPLALFHFFYWLLYELGCVNLTIPYSSLFKSCLNSGNLTCQLHTISFDGFLSSLEWSELGVLLTKTFDILSEIIMEYQI